ncbi:hypothetical protein SLA2020_405900 [Shorea laevis]
MGLKMIVIKGRVESKKGSHRIKMMVATKQMHKSNKASVGFCICGCSGSRTISSDQLLNFTAPSEFPYSNGLYVHTLPRASHLCHLPHLRSWSTCPDLSFHL